MKNIWSNDVDSVLSVGRNLENIGILNWALDREAALLALEKLSEKGVGVLGGDVYTVSGTTLEPNYDSWFCNHDNGEVEPEFNKRSIAKAIDYISNYPIDAGDVMFVMVPNV